MRSLTAATLGPLALRWLCAIDDATGCATDPLPDCWCHPDAWEPCPRHASVDRCRSSQTSDCWLDALRHWWATGRGYDNPDELTEMALWIGSGQARLSSWLDWRETQDDDTLHAAWWEEILHDPDGNKERWGRQALDDSRRRGLSPAETCRLAGHDPIPF